MSGEYIISAAEDEIIASGSAAPSDEAIFLATRAFNEATGKFFTIEEGCLFLAIVEEERIRLTRRGS